MNNIKIATVRNPRDSKPRVEEHTVDEFVRLVSTVPRARTTGYEQYHFQKSELKRLTAEASNAKDRGDIDTAKELKRQATLYKDALNNAKFGAGILPFVYERDETYYLDASGRPHRAGVNSCTHFSMLVLDVESRTTIGEITEAIGRFHWVLWPTVSHRPEDPRYRVCMFLDGPLPVAQAQALILRIDALLPDRNPPSSTTRCIDPVSAEAARLMFLPRWLDGHPDEYRAVHNHGVAVSDESLPSTPEIESRIAARARAQAEHQEERRSAARSSTSSSTSDATVVDASGKVWLNPDFVVEADDGYYAIREIKRKHSGVRCPVHHDASPSEFIAPNRHTGRPQLVCKQCGVIKMHPGKPWHDPRDDDAPSSLVLVRKKRDPQAAAADEPREVVTLPLVDYVPQQSAVVFEERYLPDLTPIMPERGVLFVRSPKGTGKTHGLARAIRDARRQGRRVLVLTHRRTLATNLSARLGLANYQDQESLTDYVVVCVNSLSTMMSELDDDYDLVIVDESEQVLRNFLGDHLKRDINDVFSKTLRLIERARQVVCLDADMTYEVTLTIIDAMRNPAAHPDDEYRAVVNEHLVGEGLRIDMRDTMEEMVHRVHELSDRRLFVITSTKRVANAVSAMLKDLGRRVLLLTGETNMSRSKAVDEFQADPNEAILKYDAVVASPALQTGVSIDREYFDHVIGIFPSVDGITWQDHDQAIHRVRRCANPIEVFIEERKLDKLGLFLDPVESLAAAAKAKSSKSRRAVRPGEAVVLTEGEKVWALTESALTVAVAADCHGRRAKFAHAANALGFTCGQLPRDTARVEAGSELWMQYDQPSDQALRIFSARPITMGEYLELRRKHGSLSEDEYLSIRRYRLAEKLGDDMTFEMVQQALKDDLLSVLYRARMVALESDANRREADVRSLERNSTTFTRADSWTMEHELLVDGLVSSAGLDFVDLCSRLASGEDVLVSAATMDAMCDAVDRNAANFRHFFKLRSQSIQQAVRRAEEIALAFGGGDSFDRAAAEEAARLKRRKRVWDATLGRMGLKLSSRREWNADRTAQHRSYMLSSRSLRQTATAILAEKRDVAAQRPFGYVRV